MHVFGLAIDQNTDLSGTIKANYTGTYTGIKSSGSAFPLPVF